MAVHNSFIIFLFQAARKENITLYNLTDMTEEVLKGYVNDNPDLFFYQLVYGLTFCIMMFIGLMKGIGIARQLLLGMFILHCFVSVSYEHIILCNCYGQAAAFGYVVLRCFVSVSDEHIILCSWYWQAAAFGYVVLLCFLCVSL
jgi:hypothetical protein